VLTAVALALPAPPAAAEDNAATAITDIRQENTERSTRLTIECTGPLTYTYYSPDPLTLVVDIPEVDASRVPQRVNVGTREVESIRLTSMAPANGRSLARLEVRLASLVPYQIFSKNKSLHLVFDRPAVARAVEPPASAGSASANSAAAAGAPADQPAPLPAPPSASGPASTAPAAPAPLELAPPAVETKDAAPERVAGEGAAAEPETVSGPRASRILGISRSEEDGQLALRVKADGRLSYQDFFLANPERLVLDFPDVLNKAPMRALDVNEGPVRKARLGQFSLESPKVARLVLDLESRPAYRVIESSDGVRIVFGESPSARPILAALRPEGTPTLVASAAPIQALGTPAGPAPAVAPDAPLPGPLPAPGLVPALPEPQLDSSQTASEPLPGEQVYTGEPISMDFKDGDLQDIFRLFADISGENVVVNPGISGKVTLKLNQVPWDQALDIILKTNGLGYTRDGNVIRIARIADLQKEKEDLRKLKEAKDLEGDLADLTQRISYAKAADLSSVLKSAGALSARGSINVDPRTNTMLIRDLPAYLEKAKALIVELDRATLQVEIEARIVVTTRNFTRDLGIQWGFNAQKTPPFQNTTNLAFPNAFIVNGQGVPASGGLEPGSQDAIDAGIGSTGRGYAVNLPATGFNSAIGINLGNILGNFNLDAALTALERQGRGRLLSTPKVTTQNNQEATIKQGVQIPIQTVANNTVTVTFKDAVLTLRVTPQITEAGTVILGLEVENNSADFANLVNGIPPINTQSARTNVLVRDGSTAVIGGIYQSNEQTTQSSTPFLGKLPILGYLFRNRFVTSQNNELLLFITPRIIKG
jgi:type IV pilus assembly protein PilQ